MVRPAFRPTRTPDLQAPRRRRPRALLDQEPRRSTVRRPEDPRRRCGPRHRRTPADDEDRPPSRRRGRGGRGPPRAMDRPRPPPRRGALGALSAGLRILRPQGEGRRRGDHARGGRGGGRRHGGPAGARRERGRRRVSVVFGAEDGSPESTPRRRRVDVAFVDVALPRGGPARGVGRRRRGFVAGRVARGRRVPRGESGARGPLALQGGPPRDDSRRAVVGEALRARRGRRVGAVRLLAGRLVVLHVLPLRDPR
mmetsp:Transcript_14018/g.45750  ORF Transcript_14018/g.45750 Transcript_14018/m.45750 type:complete len:254 (-) Transcript_14018:205-966(-)